METDGICEHKGVFPIDKGIEWLGAVITSVVICLSNMGGMGGGGAVIPIAMIFFGFDTK